MTIRIAREAADAMLAHADDAAPEECCGLLLGQGDRVTEARATANIAQAPQRHFEIDPSALIAAERADREGGLQLLGYYHSHPHGLAEPSATDRSMAPPDGRLWFIIADGNIAAFRAPERAGDAFRRYPLEIDRAGLA